MGAQGGGKRSPAKAKAARENSKRSGWPKGRKRGPKKAAPEVIASVTDVIKEGFIEPGEGEALAEALEEIAELHADRRANPTKSSRAPRKPIVHASISGDHRREFCPCGACRVWRASR